MTFLPIPALDLTVLGEKLGWSAAPLPRHNELTRWDTENDDAPILRHIFENHRPQRHLEFGTWQGFGTCLCLESCSATVWTVNLPDGEAKPDGSWAYGERVLDERKSPPGAVTANYGQDESGPRTYHRTDAATYIGRLYREKQLGHRVCQIYCDSRSWDTSAYPADFFQSVFIDGGHQTDVVMSDTRKALSVLGSCGIILWHDYCPQPEIRAKSEAIQGVTAAINKLRPELAAQLSQLGWIAPSQILLGIKK